MNNEKKSIDVYSIIKPEIEKLIKSGSETAILDSRVLLAHALCLTKSIYTTTKIITAVDFRAKNLDSIDNLEKNSLDFYASVKSLYLQDRQQKIANSNPTIEIMYEGDWEEVESQ